MFHKEIKSLVEQIDNLEVPNTPHSKTVKDQTVKVVTSFLKFKLEVALLDGAIRLEEYERTKSNK
jgi:hypothetical protein